MTTELAVVRDQSGSDSLPGAFVPEAFLPEQYFDRLAARATDTPEKRLMFAVLLDAVIHLQRRNTRGAAEAEQWIRDERLDDSPFSFGSICESLGLDATYLARGLLAWRTSAKVPLGVPVRQLRTAHRRITPLRQRRRRMVAPRYTEEAEEIPPAA